MIYYSEALIGVVSASGDPKGFSNLSFRIVRAHDVDQFHLLSVSDTKSAVAFFKISFSLSSCLT